MKEIKDNRNGKTYHIHVLEKLYIVKMTIHSKAICVFNAIPIKIPRAFFTELEKNNSEICIKTQKTLNIVKTTLRKKNIAWGIMLPDFKLGYINKSRMVLAQK